MTDYTTNGVVHKMGLVINRGKRMLRTMRVYDFVKSWSEIITTFNSTSSTQHVLGLSNSFSTEWSFMSDFNRYLVNISNQNYVSLAQYNACVEWMDPSWWWMHRDQYDEVCQDIQKTSYQPSLSRFYWYDTLEDQYLLHSRPWDSSTTSTGCVNGAISIGYKWYVKALGDLTTSSCNNNQWWVILRKTTFVLFCPKFLIFLKIS